MSEAELLEAAADQALATSNGDACKAIKALIAAKHFLEPNWKSCAPPQAFWKNYERLKAERLAREAAKSDDEKQR
jgi:hypothetical protein